MYQSEARTGTLLEWYSARMVLSQIFGQSFIRVPYQDIFHFKFFILNEVSVNIVIFWHDSAFIIF